MIEYVNWASSLTGISPVARLLAFLMANNVWRGEIDLDAAIDWVGCTEAELLLGSAELLEFGVEPFAIEGRTARFTLPSVVDLSARAAVVPGHTMSIYVIFLSTSISKIGISVNPAIRLANLQACNPVEEYKIAWTFKGPAKLVRRAEWLAHQRLSRRALGNEWFRVGPDRAIEIVKVTLAEAGLAS